MERILLILAAVVILGVTITGGLEAAWDNGYAQIFEWLPDPK